MSTAITHIENKKKLVPSMRFKEFVQEYNFVLLKDLIEDGRKIRYGIVQPGKFDENGRFVIRGKDYSSVKGWAKSSEFFRVSEEVERKYKKARVKSGDLLITIVGAGTGWMEVVPDFLEGANITQTTGRIAIDKSKASSGYVKNYYFSHRGKKEINSYIKGQAQPGLNIGDVEIFKLNIPPIPEQKKIASFLSAVDEKIQQLTKKEALLAQFKKGVMQQLFSGQLRFKPTLDDVEDLLSQGIVVELAANYPDWEEKRLSEITTSIKRTTDRVIENIMTISGKKGFMSQKERFSKIIAAKSLGKYTHILKNEFAYNRGNSKSYKYGCVYKMKHDEALIPFVYHSFSLDNGVPEFMEQLFRAKYLDRQLRRMISSSARMDGLLNIGGKAFFQVTVFFPVLEEQQKIATYLSSIDTKIESVKNQITQTQIFKKGLLQQMFV